MEYIEFFNEGITDPAILGGKGSSLIKLMQIGVRVPPGFILKANSYKTFIDESEHNEQLKTLLKTELSIKKVLHISKVIKQLIRTSRIPSKIEKQIKTGLKKLKKESGSYASYAVRSSATIEDTETFSFAGQAKSYLYNKGFDEIILSVKKCWASLFTPSALFYIIQMNKKGQKISLLDIQMAVVIQKMVDADVSGVLFTSNVLNNNNGEMMINSTWGLGETIANNIIIPDMFILNKKKFEIIKYVIGAKEKKSIRNPNGSYTIIIDTDPNFQQISSLNENQLQKLYHLGLTLEREFKYPQDIEWAIENDIIYTLQSRPITTLKKEI
ncbi:MAG: PEP/pyruvate-binding domain-containing protein [Promethearchaeota archaeon]